MDKYAVLVTSYPTKSNPAPAGFVHSRVKAYLKNGLNIFVLCLGTGNDSYEYEGVTVYRGNVDYLRDIIEKNQYKKVLVHFLLREVEPLIYDQNLIVWVHGFEALSWKRRLFNISWKFPAYILKNKKQLKFFKRFVEEKNNEIHFVFVSEWMREIAQADCGVVISNYSIIPNYIDGNIFDYIPKKSEQKNNILIIRSFSSRKYANDISVKIIEKLSQREYFPNLNFDIYGTGRYFKKLTNKIRKFDNVSIHERSLSHSEISELHKKNGVFLCPTRQDAQGVSMCEAMSSGCVPITSKNTAIPEFVNEDSGFLCDNSNIDSFLLAFDKIQHDDVFMKYSDNTHQLMTELCSIEKTIYKEIEIIKA